MDLTDNFRSTECSMLCVKTLLRILRHHNIYKDVFREVGLLEVMVTCLHRYAALLKEPHDDQPGNGITISSELQIYLNLHTVYGLWKQGNSCY